MSVSGSGGAKSDKAVETGGSGREVLPHIRRNGDTMALFRVPLPTPKIWPELSQTQSAGRQSGPTMAMAQRPIHKEKARLGQICVRAQLWQDRANQNRLDQSTQTRSDIISQSGQGNGHTGLESKQSGRENEEIQASMGHITARSSSEPGHGKTRAQPGPAKPNQSHQPNPGPLWAVGLSGPG